MSEYKAGEFIIYQNGERFQLGKIKRVTDDGAFVYYSEGDTAAKTPFHCMRKIENAHVIKSSSLGGEKKTRRAKGPDLERCDTCQRRPFCESYSLISAFNIDGISTKNCCDYDPQERGQENG